ncbi:MAG: 2OG-Fe(II) oxygenase [Byssovorax sp.]
MPPRALALARDPWPFASIDRDALLDRLDAHLGLALKHILARDTCAAWSSAVLAARAAWTVDFDGDQFALGRAFYTHLETDRAGAYFTGAAASDALVEEHLPGMQDRVIDLYRALLGGEVRRRPRWCGPGVHIFPAGGWLAQRGGVVHFDTEGLSEHQMEHDARALTLVLMLQPPETGGGLRLWDVVHEGHDEPTPDELACPSEIAWYQAGDALLLDSYRLHQIQPFGGARDRISITAHAVEVDEQVWDVWF